MPQAMRAKFGISLSNRAVLFDWATTGDLITAARTAEDSGYFHSVRVGDNLLPKPWLESIVTLSAIAAHTASVKLGTTCLASFPLRDPILLAIQWASLDVLSAGRTILSVCNGASELDGPQFAHELEVMGVRSNERVGRSSKAFGYYAACGAKNGSPTKEDISSLRMWSVCPNRCSNSCPS